MNENLYKVANRAPEVFLERERDGKRESPVTLFGSYLRVMGLNVLGYQ